MPGYALMRCVVQTAGLAALCAAVSFGVAEAAPIVGWVFANQPGGNGSYTPNPAFSYNSSGGSITVTNLGDGGYTVDFAGLYNKAHLNNVQVSAYGGTAYCTSYAWDTEGPGKAAEMTVICYDHNGRETESAFTLEYQQRTKPFGDGTHGIAFLLADQPTNPNYTPNPLYNYNSAGGVNTVVRGGAGGYQVHIPFLESVQSDVQVTADSAGSPDTGAHCAVLNWVSDGGSGTLVNVQCSADTEFSLAYAVRAPLGLTASATSRGAWAWANSQGRTTLYTPSKKYQYNGFGTGYLTAQKEGTGTYTITIPGNLSYNHSSVLVTPVDPGGGTYPYCNIASWEIQTVTVQCRDGLGDNANSQFNVVFQTYQ
jgi:hypothetical protein